MAFSLRRRVLRSSPNIIRVGTPTGTGTGPRLAVSVQPNATALNRRQHKDGFALDVVCFELDDNPWRYTENDLERMWRGYKDGGSLDDQILRINANGWLQIDIYATDGPRHPGDPCAIG